METILQTTSLRKHFGPVRAVEDVSLEVRRGEIYGFLGPNGAGKTTTIGMLLGLVHPTAGTIEIFGQPVSPTQMAPLKRIGALVGASAALIPYLSARENLALLARLHPGMPRQRVDELLEMVGLAGAADRTAGRFSTGMKQRLGLAMALIHQPDLLILDEPTNGLDPAGMREVRNLLRGLANGGVTVFISSHLLHEIEQIGDRVAVLSQGRVVAQGAVSELLGGQTVVRVRVDEPAEAAQVLRAIRPTEEIDLNGSYVHIRGMESKQVVAYLVSQGIVPSEVTTASHDLESLFMQLTQEAE